MASFLVALSVVLLGACDAKREELILRGPTMGTSFSVKYLPEADSDTEALAKRVPQLLAHLDATLSTYQPQSELNQLNNAAVDEAVVVGGELWQVLLIAQRVYAETRGAFDPTVGPLVDLWGFGPVDTGDQIPAQVDIDARLLSVGFNYLEFIPSTQSVRKLRDIRIDLSAIAKGYAAESVATLLHNRGITNFMVEVGGELRLAGVNAHNEFWRIAIEVPSVERGAIQKIIAVSDVGIATSGDYRNYFEKDGVRYSHTIDPRTGRPLTHNLASVTVLADDATYADALATGFMVMGADAALAGAARLNIGVYLLLGGPDGTFIERSSAGFKPYLREN